MKIQPFAALRPSAKTAKEVIAPPYNVVSLSEARQLVKDQPWSFLHLSRPEINFEPGLDISGLIVFKHAAKYLHKMRELNILQIEKSPCYYVYRTTKDGVSQTGIAAIIDLNAYKNHTLKQHEYARIVNIQDRSQQIKDLRAQTGPVVVSYARQKNIDDIIANVTTNASDYSGVTPDTTKHEIWIISDKNTIAALSDAFDKINQCYIADGHHRAAAAYVTHEELNTPKSNWLLSILFSDQQLQTLGYHRVVRNLYGMSANEFCAALSGQGIFQKIDQARLPKQANEIIIYIDKHWYSLTITDKNDDELPTKLLQEYILGPLLRIQDPREDDRVRFVGGSNSVTKITNLVDTGKMAAGFLLYPTTLQQLMEYADNEVSMPFKSTWFEPKLADGLLSYLID